MTANCGGDGGPFFSNTKVQNRMISIMIFRSFRARSGGFVIPLISYTILYSLKSFSRSSMIRLSICRLRIFHEKTLTGTQYNIKFSQRPQYVLCGGVLPPRSEPQGNETRLDAATIHISKQKVQSVFNTYVLCPEGLNLPQTKS